MYRATKKIKSKTKAMRATLYKVDPDLKNYATF